MDGILCCYSTYRQVSLMKLRYSEALTVYKAKVNLRSAPVFPRTFGCNFPRMNFGLGRDEPRREEKHKAGNRYNDEACPL